MGMDKFVLNVPEWQGELVFSKEILILVGVILLIVVGILFCFWGYKYFGTILFMGIGAALCYGSFLLVEPMTDNSVIRMFLTVSLTFLGLCFAYFLSMIWGFILDKLRIRTALAKRTYLLAAPLGAAILGLTIYFMIWRDEIVAGAIAAVCLIIGLIFQHSKKKKQVRFRTYNDLLKLSRPEVDDSGLEFISIGAEAAAVAAAPIPEPVEAAVVEVEAEPEPVEAAVVEVEAEPEPVEAVEVEVAEVEAEPEVVETMPIESTAVGAEPEPESVKPMSFEPEPTFIKQTTFKAKPEPVKAADPKPTKISIRMESKESEIEVDISKEGLSLKRKNSPAKGKNSVSASNKKQDWKLAGGAALVAFGLGFLFSKTSKGGD